MSTLPRRFVNAVSVGGVSAVLLIAATAGPAAAATSFHSLTPAMVLASLPAASDLPAGTKLAGKVQVSKAASARPCGTSSPKVSLAGASSVAALYSSGKVTASGSTVSVWTISAAVFATHAQASSAATRLAAVQAKCPATVKSGSATLIRTVLAADTSEKGLWKGVRSVAHISVTAGKTTVTVRLMTTWFERGNVLVQVSESAPLTADSGPTQDRLRKAVTVATLVKLDAAAA